MGRASFVETSVETSSVGTTFVGDHLAIAVTPGSPVR